MKEAGHLEVEIAALRDRLSRLSEASLRINESLDLEKVLQDVIDSARVLTDARYGVLVTLDSNGQPDELCTSGMNAEELKLLESTPDAFQFFEYFRNELAPIRLANFPASTETLGLPDYGSQSLPIKAILGTPIRHRGAGIGIICVGKVEDGHEFSSEDEETLVMFASQAALVVSNALRYKEVLRARADLEAFIDISPVGVAAFNIVRGELLSINREMDRILDGIRSPEQSLDQLLKTITVRFSNGQEFSMESLRTPKALGETGSVSSKEVTFQVPDGRSVTVLASTAAVSSDDGEPETLIVTLQDMKPLRDLDLLRAEFLGIVSHELRTPLTAIKGSASTLIEASSSLDSAEVHQFYRIINEQADYMRGVISDLIDVVRIETGTLSVSPQPVNVPRLVDEARNTFLSAGGRVSVRIKLAPDLPLVMADRKRIVQVLNNLLSNAARNSPETSIIRVSVTQEDLHVSIAVSDDGRGLTAERLPHLFRKFSHMGNQERDRDLGLGLAICRGIVEAHGGRIWAESDGPGLGSRFTFTVPLAEEADIAAVGAQGVSPRKDRAKKRGQTRVLAVDDDPRALQYVRDTLTNAGYEATVTADPEQVSALMVSLEPHVVLLDLMFPGIDGIELMREILAKHDVPVIFLSAYDQDETIARAFEMGAVDYVIKPFSPTELAARVKAAMRKQSEPAESFTLGELTVDYAKRAVTVAGRSVGLTAIEYQFFTELSLNAGVVLTYDQLLQRVWGSRGSGDIRPMRTVVKSIRSKLGDDARNPKYITTIPRVGFRMEEPK